MTRFASVPRVTAAGAVAARPKQIEHPSDSPVCCDKVASTSGPIARSASV